MAQKSAVGHKVRRLRRKLGLTQVQMASELGISASYLNLIEHNQRTLTVQVLLQLGQLYEIDVQSFAVDDGGRLVAELSEVFGDPLFEDDPPTAAELADLAEVSPAAAQGVMRLYRAYRDARHRGRDLAERLHADDESVGEAAATQPGEEVSDLIQGQRNHFPELDEGAEQLYAERRLGERDLQEGLIEHLRERFDVKVEVVPSKEAGGAVRRFDAASGRLLLSEVLAPRSRHFQIAHQIGLLQFSDDMDRYGDHASLSLAGSRALSRVALANYFAGAVLMPYGPFLEAAKTMRYDVERLGHRFRTSFEQICHRLTTLQRPGAEGVPFHMIRVDIAGNISKRFSASGIRFARYGGACPRWNVFSAFLQPGFIRTQLSRMPDGTLYFCIARTVRKEGGGYRMPQSRFSIGLGTEVSHARELVYADGVDLSQIEAAVPIGQTCRLCERMDCAQRAFPPVHHRFDIDANVRHATFYVSDPKGR